MGKSILIIMVAQPYEWTMNFFSRQVVPECIKHLDEEGVLLGVDGKHLKQGAEVPYITTPVNLIVYDTGSVLAAASEMLTHKKELTGHSDVSTLDRWVAYLQRDHPPDLTHFCDTEKGVMAFSPGKLKNNYEGVNIDQLLKESFPEDFNHGDGSKTLAALLTSKVYENKGINVVVLRKTLEGVSGSVLHFREGRIVGEVFARYNPKEKLIELVRRPYKLGAQGVVSDAEKVLYSLLPYSNGERSKVA